MKKADPVVVHETGHIALGVAVCSVLMEAVFLLIGKWDYTVPLGNLLGAAWAILNFFLMGLTVQRTTALSDSDMAKKMIQSSYSVRTLGTCAIVVIGFLVPCFHWVATACCIFFPRLTIAVMTPLRKKPDPNEPATPASPDTAAEFAQDAPLSALADTEKNETSDKKDRG